MRAALVPMLAFLASIVDIENAQAGVKADRHALELRAEEALAALRYEDAFPLYESLEKTGGNDAQQIRVVYQRLAELAATMRQSAVAVTRYQMLLAIDPKFVPEPGSPRIYGEAFELARQRLGPLAPLAASAILTEQGAVHVDVARDALALVGGVAAYRPGESSPLARAKGGPRFRIALPVVPTTRLRILLEDVFGNQLIELPPVDIVASRQPRAGRQWFRRPAAWLGTASAIAGATGLALGATVAGKQDALDAILANPTIHMRSEAVTARDSLQRRALQANIGYLAAGALAVGTVVALWMDLRSTNQPAIAITAAGAATFGLRGAF